MLYDRFLITCFLGFVGFLRISELLGVRIKDVAFSDVGVKITIPPAKTDQQRDVHIVMLTRTGNAYCPVYWLEYYLPKTGLDGNPEAFLLCRLFKTKTGHKAWGGRGISYSCMREQFLDLIAPICPEVSRYGLPSLRSGGATAVVN